MGQSKLGDDDFYKKKRSDERDWRSEDKYPIIWKKTPCQVGDCLGSLNTHRWGVPMCAPNGSMTECFDCHKTRVVHTDSNPDIWLNNPNEKGNLWVRERLAVLNSK